MRKNYSKYQKTRLDYSNFTKEKWECMCSLAYDKIIVMKKADKGKCVVVRVHKDHIVEVKKKQRSDYNIHKEAKFKSKI